MRTGLRNSELYLLEKIFNHKTRNSFIIIPWKLCTCYRALYLYCNQFRLLYKVRLKCGTADKSVNSFIMRGRARVDKSLPPTLTPTSSMLFVFTATIANTIPEGLPTLFKNSIIYFIQNKYYITRIKKKKLYFSFVMSV